MNKFEIVRSWKDASGIHGTVFGTNESGESFAGQLTLYVVEGEFTGGEFTGWDWLLTDGPEGFGSDAEHIQDIIDSLGESWEGKF